MHSLFYCVGTIPQTLLTQGQPPLHKGALGAVELHKCVGILILLCKGERIATVEAPLSQLALTAPLTGEPLCSAQPGRIQSSP